MALIHLYSIFDFRKKKKKSFFICFFFFLIYSVAAHQCDLKVWRNGTDRDVICSYRLFINPEWFPIIPHKGGIYYIWNSVVFPFNTQSQKKNKKLQGWVCPRTDSWRSFPLNVKHTSHSVTKYILFSWAIPRTRMTKKRVFQKRCWNDSTSQAPSGLDEIPTTTGHLNAT